MKIIEEQTKDAPVIVGLSGRVDGPERAGAGEAARGDLSMTLRQVPSIRAADTRTLQSKTTFMSHCGGVRDATPLSR